MTGLASAGGLEGMGGVESGDPVALHPGFAGVCIEIGQHDGSREPAVGQLRLIVGLHPDRELPPLTGLCAGKAGDGGGDSLIVAGRGAQALIRFGHRIPPRFEITPDRVPCRYRPGCGTDTWWRSCSRLRGLAYADTGGSAISTRLGSVGSN